MTVYAFRVSDWQRMVLVIAAEGYVNNLPKQHPTASRTCFRLQDQRRNRCALTSEPIYTPTRHTLQGEQKKQSLQLLLIFHQRVQFLNEILHNC